MDSFTEQLNGYKFEMTYGTLEAAYHGQHKFSPQVESLANSEAKFTWLPNPDVGILNAKYLLESFVILNMKNSSNFIADFHGYSACAFGAVGTVGRAINQLLASFKISRPSLL
jgi:hypothetical protein